MTLAGVYGFWKYVSKLERRQKQNYLNMFYILKYRDLAKTVPLPKEEELVSEKPAELILGDLQTSGYAAPTRLSNM
eukprot:Gb_27600 [translate_table: standard]